MHWTGRVNVYEKNIFTSDHIINKYFGKFDCRELQVYNQQYY